MVDLLTRARTLRRTDAWIFGTMLVSASLSLTASLVLAIDAWRLAADPAVTLSCNINAVLSCGTVGSSWQAHVFGFPNAFIGLMAEPVVITIAIASLGGVRFPRWFMFSAQVVYSLGFIFAYWLFYQSMVYIGALCPWCLLVTASTTLVFSTLTHVNIRDNNLFLPARTQTALENAVDAGLDAIVVTVWLLALALLIILKYGDQLFA